MCRNDIGSYDAYVLFMKDMRAPDPTLILLLGFKKLPELWQSVLYQTAAAVHGHLPHGPCGAQFGSLGSAALPYRRLEGQDFGSRVSGFGFLVSG